MLMCAIPTTRIFKREAALGTAKESHGCFVVDASPPAHSYDAVVCTGVDELGAVYEIRSHRRLVNSRTDNGGGCDALTPRNRFSRTVTGSRVQDVSVLSGRVGGKLPYLC